MGTSTQMGCQVLQMKNEPGKPQHWPHSSLDLTIHHSSIGTFLFTWKMLNIQCFKIFSVKTNLKILIFCFKYQHSDFYIWDYIFGLIVKQRYNLNNRHVRIVWLYNKLLHSQKYFVYKIFHYASQFNYAVIIIFLI